MPGRNLGSRSVEIMRVLLLADKPMSGAEISEQLTVPMHRNVRHQVITRVLDLMECSGFVTYIGKEKRWVKIGTQYCSDGMAQKPVNVYWARLKADDLLQYMEQYESEGNNE